MKFVAEYIYWVVAVVRVDRTHGCALLGSDNDQLSEARGLTAWDASLAGVPGLQLIARAGGHRW